MQDGAGGGRGLGLGAVEVELAQDGVDVQEQEGDVPGIQDYNTQRRHSALGMMSPAGCEQALKFKAGEAA